MHCALDCLQGKETVAPDAQTATPGGAGIGSVAAGTGAGTGGVGAGPESGAGVGAAAEGLSGTIAGGEAVSVPQGAAGPAAATMETKPDVADQVAEGEAALLPDNIRHRVVMYLRQAVLCCVKNTGVLLCCECLQYQFGVC